MSDEEGFQYARSCIEKVVGKERMWVLLFPSGHNPMEPNTAEYNQQVWTNNILNTWAAYKDEVARQELEVLMKHYVVRYDQRVDRLVAYGPHLTKGIDEFLAAMQVGNFTCAENVVDEYTAQVLEPIDQLLKLIIPDIPLESIGANKLKAAWDMSRFHALFNYLNQKNNVHPKMAYMAQKLNSFKNAIANSKLFVSPLANAASCSSRPRLQPLPAAATAATAATAIRLPAERQRQRHGQQQLLWQRSA
jgi:hypothetical protein